MNFWKKLYYIFAPISSKSIFIVFCFYILVETVRVFVKQNFLLTILAFHFKILIKNLSIFSDGYIHGLNHFFFKSSFFCCNVLLNIWIINKNQFSVFDDMSFNLKKVYFDKMRWCSRSFLDIRIESTIWASLVEQSYCNTLAYSSIFNILTYSIELFVLRIPICIKFAILLFKKLLYLLYHITLQYT